MGSALLPIAIGTSVIGSIYSFGSQIQAGRLQQKYYNQLAYLSRKQAEARRRESVEKASSLRDYYAKSRKSLRESYENIKGTSKAVLSKAGLNISGTGEQLLQSGAIAYLEDKKALEEMSNQNISDVIRQGIYDYNALNQQAVMQSMYGDMARLTSRLEAYSSLIGGLSRSIGLYALGK